MRAKSMNISPFTGQYVLTFRTRAKTSPLYGGKMAGHFSRGKLIVFPAYKMSCANLSAHHMNGIVVFDIHS